MKIWMSGGQITQSKVDEICPLAIPNQISTISMHIPSLVKIHWHLLKLLFRNENTDVWQADNSVKKWRNLSIRNPKPDFYNINAQTKFGENPLMFTRNHSETKYARPTNRWTDTPTSNLKPNYPATIMLRGIIRKISSIFSSAELARTVIKVKKCQYFSYFSMKRYCRYSFLEVPHQGITN